MVKQILEEIEAAPKLFEELNRMRYENKKLQEAISFLEKELDKTKFQLNESLRKLSEGS